MKLKKLCALVCSIAVTVSALCTTVQGAEMLWLDRDLAFSEKAITYVSEEKFEDIKPVTRGEAAAIIANALGMVYSAGTVKFDDVTPMFESRINAVVELGIMNGMGDGTFRPESQITREELATAMVRAYNAISKNPATGEVKEDTYADQSMISDWALEYVFAAAGLKAITAEDKMIRPKDAATRAECLEAAAKIAGLTMFEYEKTDINAPVVSAPDEGTEEKQPEASKPAEIGLNSAGEPATILPRETKPHGSILDDRDMGKVSEVKATDASSKYEVYQEATVRNQMGTSGVLMKARFGANDAIKLYCARTTVIPAKEDAAPFIPSSFLRVEDPDGRLVGFYDFTDSEGTVAVELEPAVKKEGIWTFRFIGGRTGDTVAFGFNGASSWGIAGAIAFKPTKTTPKTLYVWTQPMIEEFHVVSEGSATPLVKTPDGKKLQSENFSSNWYKTKSVHIPAVGDAVYTIDLNNYGGDAFAIDMAPSLMCPTEEMARDLKGGWVESDYGVLLQGPLQAKLYNLAAKIVGSGEAENWEITDFPELPAKEDIAMPLVEAQLYGKYSAIGNLGYAFDRQVLEVGHPSLGYVLDKPLEEWEEAVATRADYQKGDWTAWDIGSMGTAAAAASVPSQLNYYYMHEPLVRRLELWMLSGLFSLSEEFMSRENSLVYAGTTGGTHSGFYLGFTTAAYHAFKACIPEEDLELIEEAMIAFTDFQHNFRGYLSNQMQHATEGLVYMYVSTGLERYHNAFKNQIKTVITPAEGWEHFGYNREGGYFVENYGMDGIYQFMNSYFFNNMYQNYKPLENADPEICEAMLDVINHSMERFSYEYLTNPLGCETDFPTANAFTSRTDSAPGGINNYPHVPRVIDINPVARRRLDLQPYNEETWSVNPYPSTTFPHLLNNEDWAYAHLKTLYPKGARYGNYKPAGNTWNYGLYRTFYDAFYGEGKDLDYSQPLPCEGEDMIKEYEGFIAFKNKGIYGYSFYNTKPEWGFAGYVFAGGSPDIIYSDKTGGSLVSRKPTNYSAPANLTVEDIKRYCCVYWTDAAGIFRYSGKERATLKWIEEGKIWEIAGLVPDTNQTITWRYEMTDFGVRIKVSMTSVKGCDAWLNLPLWENTSGKTLRVEKYEDGKVEIGRGNDVMTYKWEGGKSILEDATDIARTLRIQFPESGEITLDISCR